jgi:hypothetical protein
MAITHGVSFVRRGNSGQGDRLLSMRHADGGPGAAVASARGRTQLDVDCADGRDYRRRRFADPEDAARIV